MAVKEAMTVELTKHHVPEIDDTDYSVFEDTYFCIRIDPRICICGQWVNYVEAADEDRTVYHVIIVWPECDDSILLSATSLCMSKDTNPKIVPYKVHMGPCIEYDSTQCIAIRNGDGRRAQ